MKAASARAQAQAALAGKGVLVPPAASCQTKVAALPLARWSNPTLAVPNS